MKLKQILNEIMTDKDVIFTNDIRKKIKVDIFANPTLEELKETGTDTPRGVKLKKNGKVYVVSNQEENNILHFDILKALKIAKEITNEVPDSFLEDWFHIPEKSLKHFACVQKFGNSWYLAEGYFVGMTNEKMKEQVKFLKKKIEENGYYNIKIDTMELK